ncbi:hypothetical protein ACFRIC_15290 [Streptomyces sp. NPDC056738]|uniref:hypothetical protein n=1 Tax=Streptomyces sp. NPDC056738 TaxID=3345933 RepID=UPI003683313A
MTRTRRPAPARIATPTATDGIVSMSTTAFFHDPLWGPAFPDTSGRPGCAAATRRPAPAR